MIEIIRTANEIAAALGHLHALTIEECRVITTLPELQAAWAEKGARLNARSEQSICGLEGWEECGGIHGYALRHTTQSGRLKIYASAGGIQMSFHAGIFEDEYGRPYPDGQPVASVSLTPDVDDMLHMACSAEAELLDARHDRVSILWCIDRQLNHIISAALYAEMHDDPDNESSRILLVAKWQSEAEYHDQHAAEARRQVALLQAPRRAAGEYPAVLETARD